MRLEQKFTFWKKKKFDVFFLPQQAIILNNIFMC